MIADSEVYSPDDEGALSTGRGSHVITCQSGYQAISEVPSRRVPRISRWRGQWWLIFGTRVLCGWNFGRVNDA